jgi:hypothetical protein
MPASKTGERAITAAIKAQNALELRIGGATLDEIAKVLGYSHRSVAGQAVQRALKAKVSEHVDEYRNLHIARLEALYMKFHGQAIQGNLQALKGCLQILIREARLLGLDAPTRTEVAGEILLRDIAGRAAEMYGLDKDEVLAEAEKILSETAD